MKKQLQIKQLELLAKKFYELGDCYLRGIKKQDIDKWEDNLLNCVAEYAFMSERKNAK